MGFDKEDFIEFALDNDVVGFGKVLLSSGRESHWYANWRTVCEDVFLIDKLSDFVIEYIEDNGLSPSTIFGVPEGATKLGIITQYKWAQRDENYGNGSHVLPMIRAVPKKHGKPEDRYYLGAPAQNSVMLEDVVTTSDSIMKHLDYMVDSNISRGINVVCLLDRSYGKAARRLDRYDVPLYSMCDAVDILFPAYARLKPGKDIMREVKAEMLGKSWEP